jgi:hypothetical protein
VTRIKLVVQSIDEQGGQDICLIHRALQLADGDPLPAEAVRQAVNLLLEGLAARGWRPGTAARPEGSES